MIVLHSLTSWQRIAPDFEDAFPGRCTARPGAIRSSGIGSAGGVSPREHICVATQRMFKLRFRESPVRTKEKQNDKISLLCKHYKLIFDADQNANV